MSQSTYYKCDGCTHSTFSLPEAIRHFAKMGKRHTVTNAPITFVHLEWQHQFDPEIIVVDEDGFEYEDDQVVIWR